MPTMPTTLTDQELEDKIAELKRQRQTDTMEFLNLIAEKHTRNYRKKTGRDGVTFSIKEIK